MTDINNALLISSSPHPIHLFLADKSASSQKTYVNALRSVCGSTSILDFPWHQIGYETLLALRLKMMQQDYSASYINVVLAAVKGVAKQCLLQDLMLPEVYQKLELVESVNVPRKVSKRALKIEEIQELVNRCLKDRSKKGVRDALVFSMLYMTGTRRKELASIRLESISQDFSIEIVGKGNKARNVYIVGNTLLLLQAWLKLRGTVPPTYLFRKITGNDVLSHPIQTGKAIWDIVQRRCDEAGIIGISPHSFRHTHITHLLENGIDVLTVSRSSGHSSPQTVQIYDRRGDTKVKEAIKSLDIELKY